MYKYSKLNFSKLLILFNSFLFISLFAICDIETVIGISITFSKLPINRPTHILLFPFCHVIVPLFYTDENECASGQHTCHGDADCIDTIGGYECVCKDGFTGDGRYGCQGKQHFNSASKLGSIMILELPSLNVSFCYSNCDPDVKS